MNFIIARLLMALYLPLMAWSSDLHGDTVLLPVYPVDRSGSPMSPSVNIFRRDCPTSYRLCSSGVCAQLGGDCCTFLTQQGQPAVCDAGKACCNEGCMGVRDECCALEGYCPFGNHCYLVQDNQTCCTNAECTAFVGDDSSTTYRSRYYSFTLYQTYLTYYYLSYELVSEERSFTTTWYIYALGTAAAESTASAYKSSVLASISAHTAPLTTPSATSVQTEDTSASITRAPSMPEPTQTRSGSDAVTYLTTSQASISTRTEANDDPSSRTTSSSVTNYVGDNAAPNILGSLPVWILILAFVFPYFISVFV